MCGIFLFRNSKVSNFSTNHFFENLKHRGPDARNAIDINEITIGHTLLSIRDHINKSVQPITSKDERFVISFNGQIYNTEQLKKKYLIDHNIILDTKIILEICNKIGIDFISKINGMFAIIIYDKVEKKVLAFRDNSGQKPLYYYKKNDEIIICSEISPILNAIDSKEIEINEHRALKFICNLEKKTIYKNIFKLLPGQKLEYDTIKDKINTKFFVQNLDIKKNFSNQNLISDTINQHLQTNKKILVNLSGGIDSNIILFESLKNRKIDAVSTVFDTTESVYNLDFSIAKKISKKYNINLLENEITKKNYFDNFIKCFETLEEINGNFNNPIYFLNYKFIRENNYRTVLNGDGGDEIFIGYDWYFFNNPQIKTYKILKLFPILKKIMFDKSYLLKTLFYFKIMDRYNSVKNLKFLFRENDIIKSFQYYMSRANEYHKFKKKFFHNISEKFEYSNLILTQLFWLSEEVFNRNDKLAMHHSIESRSPFSDYNLRNNIIAKLDINFFTTKENKKIVREIYRNKLEKEIFQFKRGWTTPREWMLDPKFKSMIIDILPKGNQFDINWNLLKEEIFTNKNFILNRSIYPLISLAILLNKNKLV